MSEAATLNDAGGAEPHDPASPVRA